MVLLAVTGGRGGKKISDTLEAEVESEAQTHI